MAPLPSLFAANATANAMLDDVPPWIRDDPDFRSVIYCYAKEVDRKREKIEEVRRQFYIVAADVLLWVWEVQAGVTINPEGLSVEERRGIVLTELTRILSSGAGSEWEEALFTLVGQDVIYEEFDPQVPSSTVADHSIRIVLPFPPSSGTYGRIEAALRRRTPANTALLLTSSEGEGGGFLLDISSLDLESFGGS